MEHHARLHKRPYLTFVFLLFTCCTCFLGATLKPVEATETETPLRVGIREIQPFIFLNSNGLAHGYSIDLWKAIANQLDIPYEFVPLNGIANTLQAMRDADLDVAIGAITIIQEWEKEFEFSYSHYHTGLGIITPLDSGYSISAMTSSFFTSKRLKRLGSFFLFFLISAHVIWRVERRHQPIFNRKYLPGVFEGVYWSVVTASTVGYGDYIPKSKMGKALAVIVIVISLPLFALFVANISSDTTLHELRSFINGPQDLWEKRVGVVSGSTRETFLARMGLTPQITAPKADNLYKLLENQELDAVVQDLPSLQYYVANRRRDTAKVVGSMFNKQDYAFLLPERSPYKEVIDQALLLFMENGTEAVIRNKWFGAEQFVPE